MNPPAQTTAEVIRDIAGPVPLPMPAWMVALIIAGAIVGLLLLGALVAWIVKKLRAKPPLTPRKRALADLERARTSGLVLEPRAFSFAVSDILRIYLELQFGLRARRQTSVEFLESLRHRSPFSAEGRESLERFLEQCDRVKYSGLENSAEQNDLLLAEAKTFVEREPATP